MCEEHKGYKGVRPPKVLCERCWRLYILEQDSRKWMEYASEELAREDGEKGWWLDK